MFIKRTRSGGHSYAQLVESFRDETGKPRQRTVATIGRLDDAGGAVDSLLNGLLRATGRQGVGAAAAPQGLRRARQALRNSRSCGAADAAWRDLQ